MSEKVNLTQLELRNKREELDIARSARDLLQDRLTSLISEVTKRGREFFELRIEVLHLVRNGHQNLALVKSADAVKVEFAAMSSKEHFFVNLKRGSVAGVRIPQLNLIGKRSTVNERDYSWHDSNAHIDDVTSNFEALISLLVKLGTAERNLRRLGAEIRKTQRRFNALDQIIIPELRTSISMISEGLEEENREELAKLQVFMRKREK